MDPRKHALRRAGERVGLFSKLHADLRKRQPRLTFWSSCIPPVHPPRLYNSECYATSSICKAVLSKLASLRNERSAFWPVLLFTLAHCCACGLQSCSGCGHGNIIALPRCCTAAQARKASPYRTRVAATPRSHPTTAATNRSSRFARNSSKTTKRRRIYPSQTHKQ